MGNPIFTCRYDTGVSCELSVSTKEAMGLLYLNVDCQNGFQIRDPSRASDALATPLIVAASAGTVSQDPQCRVVFVELSGVERGQDEVNWGRSATMIRHHPNVEETFSPRVFATAMHRLWPFGTDKRMQNCV
uniref:Uncharacterized protein n=1 Tax=Timema poppense TaxID=170557 RepID=A0A7R9HB48_TIMPO|nr:unnamed protein product [Timema poppensis]